MNNVLSVVDRTGFSAYAGKYYVTYGDKKTGARSAMVCALKKGGFKVYIRNGRFWTDCEENYRFYNTIIGTVLFPSIVEYSYVGASAP